jgi:DNA replication initiation complex subunit (GINS family)
MKKNLKVSIHFTIDSDSFPQLIPPIDGKELDDFRKLIEITNGFYERTDSYLRAILRPATYNQFLKVVEAKCLNSPDLTDDEKELYRQFVLPINEHSLISFKGVTKESSDVR